MLKREASGNKAIGEIEALVSSLGLKVVEVSNSISQGSQAMTVILYRPDREIDTEDLARAYNLIYPRYTIILEDRDLQLEVSSPGLQRNIKDVMEFSVFIGRNVRCYSISRSAYVIGKIENADECAVTLSEAKVEGQEEGGTITLSFDDIAKAKLEYVWEAGNA